MQSSYLESSHVPEKELDPTKKIGHPKLCQSLKHFIICPFRVTSRKRGKHKQKGIKNIVEKVHQEFFPDQYRKNKSLCKSKNCKCYINANTALLYIMFIKSTVETNLGNQV